MGKRFNVTGTCIPEKHYMIDISEKLKNIMKLIEDEEYFIINRPRQYGKTTTLYMLERRLDKNSEYLTISTSFEGVGDLIFEEEQRFVKEFLQILADSLFLQHEDLADFLEDQKSKVNTFNDLSKAVTKFIMKVNKKVILMIDEVDKSSNNQLFLSFLGMLRNKYLLRNSGKDKTFHSVILAGVHDVKTLKLKMRPDEEHKYNSPWNIASDFDVDMSFSKEEIGTMLEDYIKDKNVKLDREYFSDRLYFYTSGYPFFVSKLCKIIDEKIMDKNDKIWENEYLDFAVKELLKEDNTNFQSLIKNIENNKELYDFVSRIILEGESITYIKTDEIVNLGTIYGILKEQNGNCKINNKIYEQLLYNHMMMKVIRKNKYAEMSNYNYRLNFIEKDGSLNVIKILLKFQEFMKHEHSEKREAFLEEDGRLLFLAFLSPIINGTGFAFKEVKGGEEKRFDIIITYEKRIYILELKIWRGDKYHEKGLVQLGQYLEQYGLEDGYLLIFDFRKVKGVSGKTEEVIVKVHEKEKKILEVYC
ncbi:AAA family ATPase [Clostridium arbusti]|uniref:AAA family ATPase n=1 Tax=Clostridium arbusti TaxID=1137848 RepID=UPI000288750A|nr:AAA family ATPase [Clostridium arbusti]